MTEVKLVESPDKSARLIFRSSNIGLITFEEQVWSWEDIPEYGRSEYWRCSYSSGIYSNLDEAVKDAAKIISWMKQASGPEG